MRQKRRRPAGRFSERPISWLPIDSRVLPPLFSFSHVRGIAKVFLTCEMACAILVVLGTIALILLSLIV